MQDKSRYWNFVLIFVAIVATVSLSYFLWDWFSETGKARRWAREAAEAVEKGEKAYVDAMTADTYGGKTPQETLDLFVAALRTGDVELASKYFLLDEGLSREKWIALLDGIKKEGSLNQMANDIKQKSISGNLNSENEFGYILYNSDGTVGVQINLRYNRYSKIWKIESL